MFRYFDPHLHLQLTQSPRYLLHFRSFADAPSAESEESSSLLPSNGATDVVRRVGPEGAGEGNNGSDGNGEWRGEYPLSHWRTVSPGGLYQNRGVTGSIPLISPISFFRLFVSFLS